MGRSEEDTLCRSVPGVHWFLEAPVRVPWELCLKDWVKKSFVFLGFLTEFYMFPWCIARVAV